MKKQNQVRPGLPPDARAEILEALGANMEIGSDEIVAILKRHHVSEDMGILQDRYRRQLGQRLMASLRDDDGRREVMSNGKGRYFVLECCRDQRQLQSVQRRIQNQMRGLDGMWMTPPPVGYPWGQGRCTRFWQNFRRRA